MTLLEMSLSLLFMALFFMALMAATSGVTRLTRGYTCRVLSHDPNAIAPERGCVGQLDEVSVQTSGNLFEANTSALRSLRNDLLATNQALVRSVFAISTISLADPSIQVRAELQKRCLWEKAIPQKNGSAVFRRNYLKFSRPLAPSNSSLLFTGFSIVDTTAQAPLPSLSRRSLSDHIWFIRGGRLIGEVVRVLPSGIRVAEPMAGMESVEDGMLSVDANDDLAAISGYEQTLEADNQDDELISAPNRAWGIINQVCLYQSQQLPSLFLLSADRGVNPANQSELLFGNERGLASRQQQLRLLFSSQ